MGTRQARRLKAYRVGVISDTHGLVRPEALDTLRGSDRIIHAGDIGDPDILAALRAIAPVTAVRGNNDRGAWADALRDWETLAVGDMTIGVVHDRAELQRIDHRGVDAIVSGHSHVPLIEERDGILFVNPGSAGPRRFSLPVSLAEIRRRHDASRAPDAVARRPLAYAGTRMNILPRRAAARRVTTAIRFDV